jgi:hypothetical protein
MENGVLARVKKHGAEDGAAENWTVNREVRAFTPCPSGRGVDRVGKQCGRGRRSLTTRRRPSRADLVDQLPSPPSVGRGDGRAWSCQDGAERGGQSIFPLHAFLIYAVWERDVPPRLLLGLMRDFSEKFASGDFRVALDSS